MSSYNVTCQNVFNDSDFTATDLNCISFNCHGFKQSSEYIVKTVARNDVVCLTETWLRPNESNVIDNVLCNHPTTCNERFVSFTKSGMTNCDSDYSGRPFGGVAIIVRCNDNFSAREIDISSDRIIAVGLYDHDGNLVQVLLCAYFPFMDKTNSNCTQVYTEVLDQLQSVVDTYADTCAMTIFGDFNTQLPMSTKLNKHWFKAKGFNKHSRILYDFIVSNDMCAADVMFKQDVNYTYFCHAANHYTWIDHVICLKKDVPAVKNCLIVPLEFDNSSDHLPICLQMSVKCFSGKNIDHAVGEHTYFTKPNWSSHAKNDRYRECLSARLSKLSLSQSPKHVNGLSVDEWVNTQFKHVNHAIVESCKEAGCVPKQARRPKRYWCPDLSRLRDSKHFWWTVWIAADRPRSGVLFSIYKGLKSKHRCKCRRYINGTERKQVATINHHFKSKNIAGFWNMLRKQNFKHIDSALSASNFASFYSNIMEDSDVSSLSDTHLTIKTSVEQHARTIQEAVEMKISPGQVRQMIQSLKSGTAAGHDTISTEHLQHGLCDNLCIVLANLYSVMLSAQVIPEVIQTGVIIPILKKPTLDVNKPEHYRPITLSSVHSKLVEMILMPNYHSHDNQYGFTEERGTSFVTSLINDLGAYLNDAGSPMYLCTLDAEKCFDSIWHDGLFYKLRDILPAHHWLYLLKWYRSSYASVRWSSTMSNKFRITRGMKQGSLLSPVLFKIFLDDLMAQLEQAQHGVRISDLKMNCGTYADDISVFSATITGLQALMDICVSYADKWRMKFSKTKSKCMVLGKAITKYTPTWHLYDQEIQPSEEVDILGVTISSTYNSTSHVNKRTSLCRRSIYRLSTSGMCYPGLEAGAKAHIWNVIGAPTIQYGMECLDLNRKNSQQLSTCQTNIIKNVMGFSKRCHHTHLLQALRISSFDQDLDLAMRRLYHRVMLTDTPAGAVQTRLLARYTSTGHLVKHSLLARLVSRGHDPYSLIQNTGPKQDILREPNGIADSLSYLITHQNFIKPWSEEFTQARLLLAAF